MSRWIKDLRLPDRPLADVARAGRMPATARVVHLGDDRRQVTDTTSFPGSAIAQLIVTDRLGIEHFATGAFISPNRMLTAAHAVFIRDGGAANGLVRRIVVVPGRNGTGPPPFGAAELDEDPFVPDEWQQSGDIDADYAVLIVPSLPEAGHFTPVALPDATLTQLAVTIAGYPIDKPPGTQWEDRRTIAVVGSGQVAYDIDTEAGQSGSPVRNGNQVVAVHRFGDVATNLGTRITSVVHNRILAHM